MIVIVSCAVANNMLFEGFFGWVCDYDSFWVVENNLVYLRYILVGLMIMIVSWAIENNLVNLRG